MALLYNPPLFDLKVFSYVIEVADSESDLGLQGRSFVAKIYLHFTTFWKMH